MNKHEDKILHFLSAIQDCYRDEEDRESFVLDKLELSNEEITDDFFAIIQAFFFFYKNVTSDSETDLLGFTHIINRLVVQNTSIEESEE